MNDKVLVYLNKYSDKIKLDDPYIIDIKNLYNNFLDDFAHYNKISKLHKCFNNQVLKYKSVEMLIEQSKEQILDVSKVNLLEQYVTDLIAQYSIFLNELKSICGVQIYKIITSFIYDENKNYRILVELRNIVQHNKKFHFYYIENHLIVDFVELLDGYKITKEKFNKTFYGLKKIQVLGLWAMIKETQEYLTMYLYAAVCNIDQLSRFYNCLVVYNQEHSNLVIRTTHERGVDYEYIILDILEILIRLYETMPIICKDKIRKIIESDV